MAYTPYSNTIKLLDLVSYDKLNQLRKVFTQMTGLNGAILDLEGNFVIEGTESTSYCDMILNETKNGQALCSNCMRYAAMECFYKRKVVFYYCHAGLVEFSAPITLNGQLVGCFVGGGALREAPDKETFETIADELQIGFDRLWNEISKAKIISNEEIVKATSFLYTMSNLLSSKIDGEETIKRAGVELEKADRMKNDFLANMSHEIRTPMNAVVGMSEMALREDMPLSAKDYIKQIQSSGKALLNIVNDILDYSKITSGQLDIAMDEYEPMSVINDVCTIIMSRIMDKDIELLLDIDPNIPKMLVGDPQRLRQILINLANNSVKFTHKGHVRIFVRYEYKDEDNIILKISVEDTGIGIKKEDIGKLFGAFQQVDSERNKGIEGTGLGLSIVRRLLELMNGNIHVESEYGKGSSFIFELPQRVWDNTPSVSVSDPEKYLFIGLFAHDDVAEDFADDAAKIGVETRIISDHDANPDEEVGKLLASVSDREMYFVVEQDLFDSNIAKGLEAVTKQNPNYHIVILADTFADTRQWNDLPFISIIKKPVSVLNLAGLLNQSESDDTSKVKEEALSRFVAPDAKVLIVDDNSVNLTVAAGLLEPLNMTVELAASGIIALEMIDKNKYDLIFMDHMMPGIDGVETTHIIRRLHPEYNDVPIIALTANAASGARKMFIEEGMNDFVAKPIDVKILMEKVSLWLPPEMIKVLTDEEAQALDEQNAGDSEYDLDTISIGDLDLANARKMLGSDALFWNILKEYYKNISNKADKIERMFELKDWAGYTIEVHALKSASRQIGAMTLSGMAADLEKAGNARDIDTINKNTAELLLRYRGYNAILAPFCVEKESSEPKEAVNISELKEQLEKMNEASENLDMDGMEEVSNWLSNYVFDEEQKALCDELNEAASNIDVENCCDICQRWLALL